MADEKTPEKVEPFQDCPRCPKCNYRAGKPGETRTDYAADVPKDAPPGVNLVCGACLHEWEGTAAEVVQAKAANDAYLALASRYTGG